MPLFRSPKEQDVGCLPRKLSLSVPGFRSVRSVRVPIGSFIYLIFSSSGIIFHCLSNQHPRNTPWHFLCSWCFYCHATTTASVWDDEKAIFHAVPFTQTPTPDLPSVAKHHHSNLLGGGASGRYFMAVWGPASQPAIQWRLERDKG